MAALRGAALNAPAAMHASNVAGMPLCGVLLDVGGTLWPQVGPAEPASMRFDRLLGVGCFTASETERLLASLAAAPEPEDGAPQDIHAYLRDVAQAAGLDLHPRDLERVRQALCLPFRKVTRLLPHAETLLHTIRDLHLRCAILSNALFRSGADYADDFASLGLADCLTAYVSSIDVKMRKPHALPFTHALGLIGCEPHASVMVGDNERNDIAPARALGMRTIRVAIERPAHMSAADAIATDLLQVATLLTRWAADSKT